MVTQIVVYEQVEITPPPHTSAAATVLAAGAKQKNDNKKRTFASSLGHPAVTPTEDITNKRIRQNNPSFVIDLSDVPYKRPIPKISGHKNKPTASKYVGVYFQKSSNRWMAQIHLSGQAVKIGYYHNEEAAAVDYARALFKYRKVRKRDDFVIDISDVPPQPPIPKKGRVKDGQSKYKGVTQHKTTKKWLVQITVDGKQHFIGCYTNEEEAAIDYARAALKYRGEGTEKERGQRQSSSDRSAFFQT